MIILTMIIDFITAIIGLLTEFISFKNRSQSTNTENHYPVFNDGNVNNYTDPKQTTEKQIPFILDPYLIASMLVLLLFLCGYFYFEYKAWLELVISTISFLIIVYTFFHKPIRLKGGPVALLSVQLVVYNIATQIYSSHLNLDPPFLEFKNYTSFLSFVASVMIHLHDMDGRTTFFLILSMATIFVYSFQCLSLIILFVKIVVSDTKTENSILCRISNSIAIYFSSILIFILLIFFFISGSTFRN